MFGVCPKGQFRVLDSSESRKVSNGEFGELDSLELVAALQAIFKGADWSPFLNMFYVNIIFREPTGSPRRTPKFDV